MGTVIIVAVRFQRLGLSSGLSNKIDDEQVGTLLYFTCDCLENIPAGWIRAGALLAIAFQPDQSVAHVIWTHRWLAAKALKEETTIKTSGIDKSAAFDTIIRRHLLYIVKPIVDKDEHRLIPFLLSGTVIDTRMNGSSTSKPFTSNVGTPHALPTELQCLPRADAHMRRF